MTGSRPQMDAEHDVVVIGLGPTGATLANLLGGLGLSTLVLERETAAYHLPRAVHFDDEVMRIFQAAGLAEEVAAVTIVNPGARFYDADGSLLIDWARPQEIGPQGWHASYRFHQPDLEDVLRKGLARFACVTVRPRSEVFALKTGPDHAEIHYEDLDTGALRRTTARYVVGCDGARSLVRRVIGSGLDDLGFHERWVVIDLILKREKPELGGFTVHRRGSRCGTYMRNPGNRRRWELRAHTGEDARALTEPAGVWSMLSEWLTPDDADIERAAVYTFHAAIAARWREGRMLVAGDAAHQTPPFMGQGMCAGIRDAANLAWKLERVLKHGWDDALLDTYQSERAPNVRAYIETAVKLGKLVTGEAPASALAAPDNERRAGVVRMKSLYPGLGPGLSDDRQAHAGTLAPQPVLGDDSRLDDETGYAFALLADDDFWRTVAPAIKKAFRHQAVRTVTTGGNPAVSDLLVSRGAQAMLVRPDRYVFGTASSEAELAGILGRLLRFGPRAASDMREARQTVRVRPADSEAEGRAGIATGG